MTSLITDLLVDPVSVTIVFFLRNGAIKLATVFIDPTGTARITKSASLTVFSISSHTKVAIFICKTICLCLGLISYAKVTNSSSSLALIACKIEVPIKPKPIIEIFLKFKSILII